MFLGRPTSRNCFFTCIVTSCIFSHPVWMTVRFNMLTFRSISHHRKTISKILVSSTTRYLHSGCTRNVKIYLTDVDDVRCINKHWSMIVYVRYLDIKMQRVYLQEQHNTNLHNVFNVTKKHKHIQYIPFKIK